MIRFLTIITITLWLALTASNAVAQADPCPTMPEGYLCLPRAIAVKALEDSDARKALEAQVKAQDEAYDKLKDTLNDMRVEFARVSGEASILKQRAVSDAALIELLVKNSRKKSVGLINLF